MKIGFTENNETKINLISQKNDSLKVMESKFTQYAKKWD